MTYQTCHVWFLTKCLTILRINYIGFRSNKLKFIIQEILVIFTLLRKTVFQLTHTLQLTKMILFVAILAILIILLKIKIQNCSRNVMLTVLPLHFKCLLAVIFVICTSIRSILVHMFNCLVSFI